MKNEIRCLYKRKQNINTKLYKIHFRNANTLNQIWPLIEEKINHKLEPVLKKKYENLNKKDNKSGKTKRKFKAYHPKCSYIPHKSRKSFQNQVYI
jgi:hypothetical protein